jgi:cytoskeletal protein RodZ
MTQFFDKYKKIRKDQKIDLVDIENRTKINVKYLEAIENGDFDIIQDPYLRLFLKAYISEIGADPNVAVDELEEYLLKREGGLDQKLKPEKQVTKSENIRDKPKERKLGDQKKQEFPTSLSNEKHKNRFTISSTIIKGTLFILVWIVVIVVIRNITVKSQLLTDENKEVTSGILSNFVDFEQLQSDYLEISSKQTALEISPPFVVKIVTRNKLVIVSQQDSLNISSIPMAAGSQNNIYFESNLDIVLQHSNGITALINGESINDINSQPYPVRLTFSTEPNMVEIRHYSPIE